jgi:DNA-binding NarL/FixJ family response regulator
MKRERLDEILLRKGWVSEEQIKQALMRQKARGGRLGSHLMYYRTVTEAQLVQALSEQFGVPGIELTGRQIPPELIQRIPVTLADEHGILPLELRPESKTLWIAMLDPDRSDVVERVRQTAEVAHVEPHVAVEKVLLNLIAAHYHGATGDPRVDQVIELPDLFEEDLPTAGPEPKECDTPAAAEAEKPRVLMVTRAAFLKNLLVSIFEREEKMLTVVSQLDQLEAAIQESRFDHILVAEEMEEAFAGWIDDGTLPAPSGEVTVFSTVSDSLLENPASYSRMAASLIRALRDRIELLLPPGSWRPPYTLMANEIRSLAKGLGLRQLAVDGLVIAAHLLVPSGETNPRGSSEPLALKPESFLGFELSLQTANYLLFPWDVEGCLRLFSLVVSGKVPPERLEEDPSESSRGAQILALVWYRYLAISEYLESSEDLFRLKTELRRQAGRLSSSALVEAYGRLLESTEGRPGTGLTHDIFLISDPNETGNQISRYLRSSGFRVLELSDSSEAKRLYERQQPDAILINYDTYPVPALEISRAVKRDGKSLLYAFTASDRPSLIMHLLDCGFSDVFVPPFNFDILVARIRKALAIFCKLDRRAAGQSGSSGTFLELPFVDLVQTLAMSQRSIHMTLESQKGEKAQLYMQEGQLVHATCDGLAGVEAIYRIIGWRDQGSFRMLPATEFPETNVSLPNDFILLEGCRLLDEGRV